ncbi:type 12 methyltransferase [Herbaspirillum frisingense GSF30]|uniref:Type 12 methyltransferase n=1 Tax=Herbaspirillum frisingense GSF30 TaxID=864073 RepID=A0AAI9IG51_9BURK|nr:glycosyltransferase [Herbaspirillum frisingense]EOA05188.1 type 12 methyltransferase [Herbaspirillum frisingense GSF30]
MKTDKDVELQTPSLTRKAMEEFERGDFGAALFSYQALGEKLGAQYVAANLALCRRRLLNSPRHKALATIAPGKLRVAAVMDEFTFHSYDPECTLLQLDPDCYLEQLEQFQPDLLFIESAWQGFEQKWKLKISTNGPEINACIDWCRRQGIPSMFWNKEDPVHFGTFIDMARQVDYVFTTDIDCIPRYKALLEHDRVFLLCFAAQPKVHNPLEIYERKDAFNFAGSYYLRYPERQRDFSSLIDTVKDFRPVEIYDRNFDKPHPNYTFPDQYKPMILGKLPFSEIDRAYKGYRYGINMNTIKQSQSMFARRVFELLASNTVVVSNFSRGVRLLFGELVVCSDSPKELQARVRQIVTSDVNYRKFRLLGLRKVMSEHTYAHRMSAICASIARTDPASPSAPVVLLARVRNEGEVQCVVAAFSRQTYVNRTLLLIGEPVPVTEAQGLVVWVDEARCRERIEALAAGTLLGVLCPEDYYGPNYLTDLALATHYSHADAWGKALRYRAAAGSLALEGGDVAYRSVGMLAARRALFRSAAMTPAVLEQLLAAPEEATLALEKMVAIDEFNYIEGGGLLSPAQQHEVDDLQLVDQGIDFPRTMKAVTARLSPSSYRQDEDTSGLPCLEAGKLSQLLVPKKLIQIKLAGGKLLIHSRLGMGSHEYLYAGKTFSREELNLVLNSQFRLCASGELDVRTIFEFQDKDGKKLSHQINKVGDKHSLAIPSECEKVRFGLRIEGEGEFRIDKLVLGSHSERPASFVCRSPLLVLSKQYPAYDDLYRYGFLHTRIRAYRAAGVLTEVFRISPQPPGYREFEGVDVATGDAELLDATLATGQVKHVLVHMLDRQMWQVLQKYIDRIRVTVWVHGAEIQAWQRRQFEFALFDAQQIEHKKKLGDQRTQFWRGIFSDMPENLHLVFVSQSFANEVFADLGTQLPSEKYSIIHNPIDTGKFSYIPKQPDQRRKVLSIRPYSALAYANDLTVKVIQALSVHPDFAKMEFHLIGDGELFEQTVAPLRAFDNVRLERRFLTQDEIADLHKQYGIFLVPTRMDTQGVSRDEAMSSGLVPVTNEVGAVGDFVSRFNGMLCAPEDVEAMARAVLTLYEDETLFARLSAQAASSVRGSRSAEAMSRAELALICQPVGCLAALPDQGIRTS